MRILMGILPLLLIFDIEAGTQTVPLFPAASDNRQGFMRIINPAGRAGAVHITAHSDAGERRTETLSFEEGEEVKFFTSDDLENGNVQKGIVTGIGAGEGDWRLELTSDLAFVAPAYLRTKKDGFLTSLHDVVSGRYNRYDIATFNPASNERQRSFIRVINLHTSVRRLLGVLARDDAGAVGDQAFTGVMTPNEGYTVDSQTMERLAFGDGTGKWRLQATANSPMIVMNLMETPTPVT